MEMNATFNIKVSIDPNNVTTSFGTEKIDDMDTSLLASVLKVFSDMQNKLKAQVTKFYGITKEQPEKTVAAEETSEGAASENTDEQSE